MVEEGSTSPRQGPCEGFGEDEDAGLGEVVALEAEGLQRVPRAQQPRQQEWADGVLHRVSVSRLRINSSSFLASRMRATFSSMVVITLSLGELHILTNASSTCGLSFNSLADA